MRSVGFQSSSYSCGIGSTERRKLGHRSVSPSLRSCFHMSCNCKYSCCKSMNHRREVGGGRPNLGGCCKCCIENSRYAISVQLQGVSKTSFMQTQSDKKGQKKILCDHTKFKGFPFLKNLVKRKLASCVTINTVGRVPLHNPYMERTYHPAPSETLVVMWETPSFYFNLVMFRG